jgi:hypothetical protein
VPQKFGHDRWRSGLLANCRFLSFTTFSWLPDLVSRIRERTGALAGLGNTVVLAGREFVVRSEDNLIGTYRHEGLTNRNRGVPLGAVRHSVVNGSVQP